MTQRLQTIAVIGSGSLTHDDARVRLAEQCGEEILDAGFRLLCGGLGGVMEAACRGARQSGAWRDGLIVGILPGDAASDANEYVDIAIPTGLGHARNVIIAHADAVVMIGGSTGTLSEAAFAATLSRPVVALTAEGWSGLLAAMPSFVVSASSAAEAVAEVVALLGAKT